MTSPGSSLSIPGARSFRNYSIPRGSSPKLERSSSPASSGHTRRTSSGRYLSLSRDESEMGGEVSSEFAYTVQIPATPDFQSMSGSMSGTTPSVRPMDPAMAGKAEQQFVSSTIFTGGFNSVTRGHVMEKMMELEAHHPQLACARGMSCSVHGCDGKSLRDERGEEMLPCECGFRICRDCYLDALASPSPKCPGCKDDYKTCDESSRPTIFRSLTTSLSMNPTRMERRLSLLKTNNPGGLLMHQNSNGDFDTSRWLYETKGTYGYGNAVWPKDNGYSKNGNSGMGAAPATFVDKSKKPLTRKISISPGILSPYRSESAAL